LAEYEERELAEYEEREFSLRTGLGWVVKVFIVLVLVGGIFIGAVFAWNFVSSGLAGSAYEKLSVGIQEQTPTNPFLKAWHYITNPADLNTYDSVVEVNEENEDLGVKITDLESTKPFFFEDEGIVVRGMVEAAAITGGGSIVSLDCMIRGYENEATVDPTEIEVIGNGIVQHENVLCSFEPGNNIDSDVGIRRIELGATSELYTIATYDVFVIKDEEYNRIKYELGLDPFIEILGGKPDLLGPGNIMRSRTIPSPMKLSISTQTEQPFKSEDSIFLLVSLDEIWENGEWLRIDSLKITVPSTIIEPRDDPNSCDFVFTGEYDGEYKIYEVSEEVLSRINSVGESGEYSVVFQCAMDVGSLLSDEDIFQSSIIAEASYVYKVEKATTVDIRKSSV
jgi:hypothetical protein